MKHKVMIIPFITDSHGRVRFVVVKEGRYNEWSFVCGNCRKNEINNPLKTALRELREETKDTMVLSSPLKYIFKYSPMTITENEISGQDEDKDEKILFHIFIFNVQGMKPAGVIKNYYTRLKSGYKCYNKNYIETIGIAFMTITDLTRKKMWPFVISKLINNQSFWEDVAFLRNENYKHQLQQHDKEKRIFSTPTPWGALMCASGSVGRVELVPRRKYTRFAFQPKVQRHVPRSSRYGHFNFKRKGHRGW